ncbi:unnamed protein product [Adineta ricciae]|uniref:Protein kinase domain-containing protein n=1 Tax=Adineta ricciae TaxID=249248 RepID=A0A815QCH0_ADIRI|nr:unnamed protein product [Adineta ricciae]
MSTTAKNLSKSFTATFNGKRLPPIALTSNLTSIANKDLLPKSILKHSDALPDELQDDDQTITSADDDRDTPRIRYQKSGEEIDLFLNTYPSRDYTVSRYLNSACQNALNHGKKADSIVDTLLSSCNDQNAIIDTFPAPLSDRTPHTTLPVDSSQLCREDTFDIIRESIHANIRSSYTPLPPIQSDSLTSTSKSLLVSQTDVQQSISPPLINTADIQDKIEEYKQRLLPKTPYNQHPMSLAEKTTDTSSTTSKPTVVKYDISPRLQKSNVENRRVNNAERSVPAAPMKTKVSITATTTATNTNVPRVGQFSQELFQPQSKSNKAVSVTTNKKAPMTNNRIKISAKNHTPKAKVTPTVSNQETVQTTNNVIPSLSSSSPSVLLTVSNETFQVPNIITIETEPSAKINTEAAPSQAKQPSPSVVPRHTRHTSSSCSSANRHSYPVPKPLTLQGEKTVECDYPQTNLQPVAYAKLSCERRGSISIKPHAVITPLFEETNVYIQKPCIKSEPTPSTNPSTGKFKRVRPNSIKSAKSKKPIVINKPKTATKAANKIEKKCQSTNTGASVLAVENVNSTIDEHSQVTEIDEVPLSHLFDVPTVDDEDIPSCFSPTDQLTISQTTLLTSLGDIPRRNSVESVQALQIDPVPIANIEPSIEPILQPPSKLIESLLPNADIRALYGIVQDSMRKDQSIRSIPTQSVEQEATTSNPTLPHSTMSSSSHDKTLTMAATISAAHTYNSTETNLSIRPALRVVEDSLNSRGSETIDSTGSHEDYSSTPLCTENDCDEIYRTARKGKQVGKGVSYLTQNPRGKQQTPGFRDSVDSIGLHWTPKGTPEGTPTGFHRTPLDSKRLQGTPRNSKGLQGIPRDSNMESERDSKRDSGDSTGLHGTPTCLESAAYGVVWSHLTITGCVIAVKEIELDEGDSERVRDDYASVREEVNILRALNHSCIVKFLGISLENTHLVKIFMEYLPNGTIENLLLSFGPFHNDVLKKYTKQIVEGVAYLHKNNVVHRDIKGKNIMLDMEGNIKLIDFGCAKRLKKNQNTHSLRQILKSMKGTANWMAPEVIAETGHGKKADIWSIGCTLCEMATGKPPWSFERNHVAVLLMIVNGTKPPADLPDSCPESAQNFFRLCLTRDPAQRPTATDLLNHPFLVSKE